jgi:oligosaccharide repeat unit polymerase
VAYVFGTLAIRGGDFPSTALRNARGNWRELPTLLFLAALAITIFVAWATITLQEGIPILKSNIGQFRLEIPDRHHIAYQLLIGSSNLMLPLSFLYLWTAKRVRFRIAIYGFSLFIVFIFVSLGSRGHVLPAFLTIFALRHYLKKPWPTRHLLVAGLIILPLLSVTGYYRSLQEYGPAYVADLVDMGIPVKLQPLTNIYLYIRAPIVTFRSALGVIPAIVPYQHGSLTFGVLLQLLPGRHPSSDYFFKSILGHEFVGAGEPASLLGTFYADFGMVGIVLGMFATGLFVKAVYVQMFRGSLGWLLVYCFLWQKLVGGLYGGLFTYVIEILLPIAWMISVVVLTGGARPTRGSDIPAREDV